MEEEQEAPVPLVTLVNNILQSVFFQCLSIHPQSAKLQIKWIVCAQILHFQKFQGSHFRIQGVLHCEGYDYEEFPDEIMEWLLSELFFLKKMEMLKGPEGFMLYGKLEVDFHYF